MEREKLPHMCRDTERSLLPTGHHQFPSHLLGLLGVSPANPEGPGNAATVRLSPSGGPRCSLGQTVWQRGLRVRGRRAEQHSLRRMGDRALLGTPSGGLP